MYEIMKLPYPYNGLEPDINEIVLKTHYDKHYIGYVNKLNEILKSINYDNQYTIDKIPVNIDQFPLPLRGDILYNVGGKINHELYFNSMDKTATSPSGQLLNKINIQYGNFENFRKDFISRAKQLVGSGYTFLVSNNRGDLTIVNLVNQETPLSYGLTPIFTIDLWEHAYYLQYKNDRNLYIENFWNKASFKYANKKYEEILK